MKKNLSKILFAAALIAGTTIFARGDDVEISSAVKTLFPGTTSAGTPKTPETKSAVGTPETEDDSLSKKTKIRFVGSDFFAGNLEKFLKEFAENEGEIEVESELLGSGLALKKLRANAADFAIVMSKNDPKIAFPEVAAGTWRAVPIAYQVLYVAVPKSNSIEEISFYELRGIFARYAEEHLTAWKNKSAKIFPILGSRTDSAANAFFQALVFPKSPFLSGIRTAGSDGNALLEATSSHEAIAVVSSPVTAKFPSMKTLAVSEANSEAEKKTAYSPSAANIYNRDYPLSVSFYIVYPSENREKIVPVLTAIFSNEFAEKIDAENLISVPENIRGYIKKSVDALKK